VNICFCGGGPEGKEWSPTPSQKGPRALRQDRNCPYPWEGMGGKKRSSVFSLGKKSKSLENKGKGKGGNRAQKRRGANVLGGRGRCTKNIGKNQRRGVMGTRLSSEGEGKAFYTKKMNNKGRTCVGKKRICSSTREVGPKEVQNDFHGGGRALLDADKRRG